MLKLLISVFFVLASVSAEQPESVDFTDHGHFIDNAEGSFQARRSNSESQIPNPERNSEIDGKFIKQLCAGRRSLSNNLPYRNPPVYATPSPVVWRPVQPIGSDYTITPLKTIQVAPEPLDEISDIFPDTKSIQTDQTAGPVFKNPLKLKKPKAQTKESVDHILPHEEAIPPHNNPINEEKLGDVYEPNLYPTEIKIFYPKDSQLELSQPDLRLNAPLKHNIADDIHKSAPTMKKDSEEGNEFIHNGPLYPNLQHTNVDPKKETLTRDVHHKPQPECVSKDKSDDIDDLIPNSRRSMGEGPEFTIKPRPVISKVPQSVLERVQQDKRDKINEPEDQSNRYGYPPNLVSWSPSTATALNSPVTPVFGNNNKYPLDPTKGTGILPLKSSLGMLESTRICYACTTISDESCWLPNRGTTVKYCRPGHNACLTRSVKGSKKSGDLIVVRDCGNSCDSTTPLIDTDSCSICKDDLCNNLPVENGSFSISPLSALLLVAITSILKMVQ